MRKLQDPMQRFLKHVHIRGSCWVWTGYRDKDGYGNFQLAGAPRRAHRWMYEQVHGLMPPGLHLDHLCRNTSCVNPKHLQPVTPRENSRRGLAYKATGMCKRGHALMPHPRLPRRWCPECKRLQRKNPS